jgi:hypothetical protein
LQLLEENCMSTVTHNNRLQPRWTLVAPVSGQGLMPPAAAAFFKRGVGCFATVSGGMSGIDGASEPGRARLGRDDT